MNVRSRIDSVVAQPLHVPTRRVEANDTMRVDAAQIGGDQTLRRNLGVALRYAELREGAA